MSNLPEKPRSIPNYRQHSSGRAIVTLTQATSPKRKDCLLGRYGTPESHEEYDRVVGKWLLAGRRFTETTAPVVTDEYTIGELLRDYREQLALKYPPPSRQVENLKFNTKLLVAAYGDFPAAQFRCEALEQLRKRMISGGEYPDGTKYQALARKVINDRIKANIRVFKWAESKSLVPEGRTAHLKTLAPLLPGQYKVRESDGVDDVPDTAVEAVKPFLGRTVRAMVEIQRLCGCRPGEVCIMRECDIVKAGETWTYKPAKHKSQWRGKKREIELGPRAQLILRGFIGDDPEQYLFRPKAAANRAAIGGKSINEHYTRFSYSRAVQRACDRANDAAIEEAKEAGREIPEGARLVQRWAPNQLRHTAAVATEEEFGLEAASARLGHSNTQTTRIYSKKNNRLAREIAAKVG